jgi:hypothetical protein
MEINMIIRRFELSDIDKLEVQPEQKHELENSAFMKIEDCFTLVKCDEVVGIFGFCEMHKGRVMVFSFISGKASKHMFSLVKKLRKLIEDGVEKTNTDRLEMEVLSGFKHGERFAEMLGFECEGVMRKYYKGKDYKLYARVR